MKLSDLENPQETTLSQLDRIDSIGCVFMPIIGGDLWLIRNTSRDGVAQGKIYVQFGGQHVSKSGEYPLSTLVYYTTEGPEKPDPIQQLLKVTQEGIESNFGSIGKLFDMQEELFSMIREMLVKIRTLEERVDKLESGNQS